MFGLTLIMLGETSKKLTFEILSLVTFCRFGCVSFVECCGSYYSVDKGGRFVLPYYVGP